MILGALKLTKRNPARAWLLARMATWIVVLSALAKILSLPRALRIVATEVRPQKLDVDPTYLSTAIDALLEANFLVFKPSCWKRATVLHRYFALHGLPTTIIFGLKREAGGELKGHAWLESGGAPIVEPEPPAYTVTYKFPSAESFEIDLGVMAAG